MTFVVTDIVTFHCDIEKRLPQLLVPQAVAAGPCDRA